MANHSDASRALRRWLFYPAQAAVVYPLYALFTALPVDWASALGGAIARLVGPWLPLSARARRNLERALPELTPAQRRTIVRGMWDNLGRMLAEHPHLERLWRHTPDRIELVGAEHLPAADHPGRPPVLLIGGHIGNWELLPAGAAHFGMTLTMIYRRPNNPLINRLMTAGRHAGHGHLVPKGREGARALVATLARGGTVGLLVDQKMNDGVAIPFFGRPAMTAPAVAQLALKFRCPVIAVRTERLSGARFRLSVLPPLPLPDSGDRDADIRSLLLQINGVLETWIRDRPEQWLWLHRRWPD
jgi:KDO2-lipid IV(A) lauroyltransferase